MDDARIPAVGSPAPDFSGPSTDGKPVTLDQFRGKSRVILSFYPQDFSWGCTRQLCSYRDSYGEISRRNAIVLGVSVNSPGSNAKFADRNRFPFPLISDADGAIARRYGVTRLGWLLPSLRRTTFVIDEMGIIRGIVRHELALGRHLSESLAVLDTLDAEDAPVRKG